MTIEPDVRFNSLLPTGEIPHPVGQTPLDRAVESDCFRECDKTYNPGCPCDISFLFWFTSEKQTASKKGAGRYLKWITNKDQLYRTRNSTQYDVQPDWEETLGENGCIYTYS